MSSSDNIKVALAAHFPGTPDKVWKRRSKTSVSGGTERVFENTLNNQMVPTIELADGSILIDGVTYKGKAAQAPVAAPVAASTPSPVTAAPKAPKAAPAAPKASTSSKDVRNQMVAGSRWTLTRDVDLKLWMANIPGTRVNRHSYDIKDYSQVVVQHLPAGTIFTVVAKFTTSYPVADDGKNNISDGLLARVVFDDPSIINSTVSYQRKENGAIGLSEFHIGPNWNGTVLTYDVTGHEVPFMQIFDAIAPLEIPETPVYVLRDSATGELFGGWQMAKYSEDMGHGRIYHGTRSEIGKPKMVTKLSSAKKYATSSAAKASIREFTGYNEGLEEGDEGGAYYVMGGKKAMDLPPTWEMVEFDKVTGAEKRVIDVQKWLKSLNRVRVLTTTPGSAARAAYKKAEAHAEDFPVILIFQNRSVGSSTDYKGGRYSWDEKARFDDWRHGPAAIKAIDAAIKAISGKTLKSKSASAIAVSCQSLTDAIYAKMAFDFDAKDDQAIGITLLDFNTLEEIVEQQP